MIDYNIQPHTYEQAKRLGVTVKRSTNPKKKLDVFRGDKKVASVGAIGYGDYPTYLLKDKKLAEEKRRLYKARHEKDRKKVGTASYWADQLLWS